MQVDPNDRFINEDVVFNEGSWEVFDEEVEFSTKNMTTQPEEANKVRLEKRDKITKDIWVGYLKSTAKGMRWRYAYMIVSCVNVMLFGI